MKRRLKYEANEIFSCRIADKRLSSESFVRGFKAFEVSEIKL